MQADLQVQERVQVEQKKADKIDVDSEGKLTVTVRSMTGSDVMFMIKPHTQVSKLLYAYAHRQFMNPDSIHLLSGCGSRLDLTKSFQHYLSSGAKIEMLYSVVRMVGC